MVEGWLVDGGVVVGCGLFGGESGDGGVELGFGGDDVGVGCCLGVHLVPRLHGVVCGMPQRRQ